MRLRLHQQLGAFFALFCGLAGCGAQKPVAGELADARSLGQVLLMSKLEQTAIDDQRIIPTLRERGLIDARAQGVLEHEFVFVGTKGEGKTHLVFLSRALFLSEAAVGTAVLSDGTVRVVQVAPAEPAKK